ncbi:MAG: hypothetical protein ACXVW8_05705 [Nocardioidaceae bacterium]
MYFATHAAISVAVPTAIVLAAGQTPSLGLVATAGVAGVAIDVFDHVVYQARFVPRRPDLQQAWRRILHGHVRDGIAQMKQIEDSRSINRLILHSRGGLFTASVLAVLVCLLTASPTWSAAALTYLLSMHCDIVWDFKHVRHAGNWFGRPTMHGTGSEMVVRSWVDRVRVLFTLLYLPVWLAAGDLFLEVSGLGRGAVLVALLGATALIAAYLSALALLTYAALRQSRDSVGASVLARWPAARAGAAGAVSGRPPLLEYLRVNHVLLVLLVGAAVAVEVFLSPLALAGAEALRPPQPVFVASLGTAIVVSTTTLLATYLLSSTGGSLGGLVGAVVGVWTALAVWLRHDIALAQVTMLAAGLFAVVLAWPLGLVFLRMPGRQWSSTMVVSILVPEDVEPEVDLARLGAAVSAACTSAEQALGGGRHGPVPVAATSADPLANVAVASVEGHDLIGAWRVRFRPVQLVSQVAVWQTFASGGLAPPTAPEPKTRLDDETCLLTASEILDDLLTRHSEIVVQMSLSRPATGGVALHLRAFEQTSTKRYVTPRCDRLAESLREPLQAALPAACSVVAGHIKLRRHCPFYLGNGSVRVLRPGVPRAGDLRLVTGLIGDGVSGNLARQGASWRVSAIALQALSVSAAAASVIQAFR